jgi:hypothetical protein
MAMPSVATVKTNWNKPKNSNIKLIWKILLQTLLEIDHEIEVRNHIQDIMAMCRLQGRHVFVVKLSLTKQDYATVNASSSHKAMKPVVGLCCPARQSTVAGLIAF